MSEVYRRNTYVNAKNKHFIKFCYMYKYTSFILYMYALK